MNIVLGYRRSGKTTRLIEKCAKDRYSIIVCPNRVMCKIVFQQALEMGKKIPYPITFREFASGNWENRFIDKFYFDELQGSLQALSQGVPIDDVVIDVTYKDLTVLHGERFSK